MLAGRPTPPHATSPTTAATAGSAVAAWIAGATPQPGGARTPERDPGADMARRPLPHDDTESTGRAAAALHRSADSVAASSTTPARMGDEFLKFMQELHGQHGRADAPLWPPHNAASSAATKAASAVDARLARGAAPVRRSHTLRCTPAAQRVTALQAAAACRRSSANARRRSPSLAPVEPARRVR